MVEIMNFKKEVEKFESKPIIQEEKNLLGYNQLGEKIERKGWGYIPIDWCLDVKEIVEFEKNFKKRKEIVKQVLEGWEPSRENDLLLFFECLRTEFEEIQVTSSSENIIFKIPKKLVKFLPPPESYRRARQHFNNKGLFLPENEEVIKRRFKRSKIMKLYFSNANKSN